MTGTGAGRRRSLPVVIGACGCAALLVLVVGLGIGYLAWEDRSADQPAASGSPSSGAAPAPETESARPFVVLTARDGDELTPEENLEVLRTSPLTGGHLPEVAECPLPTITAAPTAAELQAFLDAGTACYAGLWAQAMSDRNLPWSTPRVEVFAWPQIPTGSACEAPLFEQTSPLMCHLDGVLYWPLGAGHLSALAAEADLPAAYLADLSRALMDAVGWQSSISFYALHYLEASAEDDPARLDAARRYGLQRQCLATTAMLQLPEELHPSDDLWAIFLDEGTWPPEPPASIPAAAVVHWVLVARSTDGALSPCNSWTAYSTDINS
ncbi:hypothetical protein [Brachybacterium phenoliresistens]|uniref:hypothetical protein n=1 Tax=Brachybacterium phenoliresistens TaxID=396014 RepID=UPI0031E414A9